MLAAAHALQQIVAQTVAQPHIVAVTDQVTQASHRAALHHVVARRQIGEHHRRAPIEARRHRVAATPHHQAPTAATARHHRRVVAHIAVVAAAVLHTVEAQHRHVDKQIFGTLKLQEYETDIQTISSGAHRHNDAT